jgi:tetratricopeptide (TPR) repeat protein
MVGWHGIHAGWGHDIMKKNQQGNHSGIMPTWSILAVCMAAAACAPVAPPLSLDIDPVRQGAPIAVHADEDPHVLILQGEMELARHNVPAALKAYHEAAFRTEDPVVAQRACELAAVSQAPDAGIEMAQRWADLAPGAVDPWRFMVIFALDKGDLGRARKAFEELLKRPDGPASSLALVAPMAEKAAHDPSVLQLFDQLPASLSKTPELLYMRGEAAKAASLWEQALFAARQASRMRPEWPPPHMLLVDVYLATKRLDAAKSEMDALLAKARDVVSLRLLLAQKLLRTGFEHEAGTMLQEVLRDDPTQPDALYALGLLAIEHRDWSEAKRRLSRLLEVDERRDDAWFYLGVAASGAGKRNEALAAFARVGEGERFLAARTQMARLLIEAGRLQEARQAMEQLRESHPQEAKGIYLAEAGVLMETGHVNLALSLLGEALAAYPGDLDLLYSLALALEKVGRIQEAERNLRAILAKAPQNAQALNALGYTLVNRTDRFQEGIALLQKAIALDPDNPAILDSLGWAYYRLKDYQQAEAYIQRSYEAMSDPEVAMHYGEVLWALGKQEQALAIWRDAMEKFPGDETLRAVMERHGLR